MPALNRRRRQSGARRGKTVQSDMVASTGLPELIFGEARTFAAAHRQDAYVPPQAPGRARTKAPATRGTTRRTRRERAGESEATVDGSEHTIWTSGRI